MNMNPYWFTVIGRRLITLELKLIEAENSFAGPFSSKLNGSQDESRVEGLGFWVQGLGFRF